VFSPTGSGTASRFGTTYRMNLYRAPEFYQSGNHGMSTCFARRIVLRDLSCTFNILAPAGAAHQVQVRSAVRFRPTSRSPATRCRGTFRRFSWACLARPPESVTKSIATVAGVAFAGAFFLTFTFRALNQSNTRPADQHMRNTSAAAKRYGGAHAAW